MTGTMVAVKGMLSTNAEKMAEAHKIRNIAKYCGGEAPRVSGFGFRVQGLGCGVWGPGLRVKGLGLRV